MAADCVETCMGRGEREAEEGGERGGRRERGGGRREKGVGGERER